MNAYRAKYRGGTIQLLEQPPKELTEKEQDVVVVFLGNEPENELSAIPARDLLKLAGIINLGGNSVNEKKALYER